MKNDKDPVKRVLILFIVCVFTRCDNRHLAHVPIDTDDFYEKCRKLVLSEKQPGMEFDFSRKVSGVDRMVVTYLGDIVTRKNDTLRILNSVNYSGQLESAARGSGYVFIYDAQNKNPGFYYVGSAWGVPLKIDNNSLVFSYRNEFCNQTTTISLTDSIPEEIFVNCTEKGGDFYSFLRADK